MKREPLRIRILDALEELGRATAEDLGAALGATPHAVRQMIHVLMDDKQVEEAGKQYRTPPKTIGPPRKLYAIKGSQQCHSLNAQEGGV